MDKSLNKLPDCMMLDVADPCQGYQELYESFRALEQKCKELEAENFLERDTPKPYIYMAEIDVLNKENKALEQKCRTLEAENERLEGWRTGLQSDVEKLSEDCDRLRRELDDERGVIR